jgi:hypothetical protein
MASELPIIAFRAAAVPDTLGDAGVLLDDKDPAHWSEVVGRLGRDAAFRDVVLSAQRHRLADFSVERTGTTLHALIDTLAAAPARLDNVRPTLQIQGDFEPRTASPPSTAIWQALDAEGFISIHCTESPAITPRRRARRQTRAPPGCGARRCSPPALTSSSEPHPPRVSDSPGRARYLLLLGRLACAGDWVAAFNASLDGIWRPADTWSTSCANRA